MCMCVCACYIPSLSLPHSVAPQSSDDLTVTVIPQSQWYFRGEELSLLATSRHADLRIEGWVHNGLMLQSTSRHVISAPGTDRSTLRIPTLESGDGGVYTVVARDAEGNEHRKSSIDIQLLCECLTPCTVSELHDDKSYQTARTVYMHISTFERNDRQVLFNLSTLMSFSCYEYVCDK